MESIKPSEIFGNASITPTDPPMHTNPEHRACAYYHSHEVDQPTDNFKGPMICPHFEEANGAFYSEDHINEIRRTAHKLITAIHAGNHRLTASEANLLYHLRDLTK